MDERSRRIERANLVEADGGVIIESITANGPPDRYRYVELVCLMLGISGLIAWNTMITAVDYFSISYPTFNSFEFVLSMAFNYPAIVVMLLVVWVGPKIPFPIRFIVSLILTLAALAFVPFLKHIWEHGDDSLYITLAACFILGSASSVLNGTAYGYSSLFSGRHIGAVMTGNGVAGIVTGFIRVITKLTFPDTPHGIDQGTVVYFIVACCFLLATLIMYISILSNPYATYHVGNTTTTQVSVQEIIEQKQASISTVLKKIWPDALGVFLIFFITLSIFPGIVTQIQSHNSAVSDDWLAIIMIFLFQIYDLVGRSLPSYMILLTRKTIWIAIIARLAFFPLFLLCVKPGDIFTSNFYPYCFMIAFALSNGYVGTVAMILGPSVVDAHEKQTAGLIMSFALQLGILGGVNFAIVMLLAVEGKCSLPFSKC